MKEMAVKRDEVMRPDGVLGVVRSKWRMYGAASAKTPSPRAACVIYADALSRSLNLLSLTHIRLMSAFVGFLRAGFVKCVDQFPTN